MSNPGIFAALSDWLFSRFSSGVRIRVWRSANGELQFKGTGPEVQRSKIENILRELDPDSDGVVEATSGRPPQLTVRGFNDDPYLPQQLRNLLVNHF